MGTEERRDRLVDAAVALLEAVPEQRLNTVALNKALFYLDLLALRDLGHTVTGATYVALPQGPVVDGYRDRLVGRLEAHGLAVQEEDGLAKPIALKTQLPHLQLNSDELEQVRTVARWVAAKTSVALSEFSHGNPGWLSAYDKNARGRRINLLIAMQQIIDADPWIDEPDDEAVARLHELNAEPGEPWDADDAVDR